MFLNIYDSFFFYRVIQSVLSDLHVKELIMTASAEINEIKKHVEICHSSKFVF